MCVIYNYVVVFKLVFELKNSWGCRCNSNYLLSLVASQHTTTCQSNNHICPYSKYGHALFNSGMGTQTQTDCAYINVNINININIIVEAHCCVIHE